MSLREFDISVGIYKSSKEKSVMPQVHNEIILKCKLLGMGRDIRYRKYYAMSYFYRFDAINLQTVYRTVTYNFNAILFLQGTNLLVS